MIKLAGRPFSIPVFRGQKRLLCLVGALGLVAYSWTTTIAQLSLQRSPDGSFSLQGNPVENGQVYTVQSTSSLNASRWLPWGDPNAWPRREVSLDLSAGNLPQQFFRVESIARGRLVAAEFQEAVTAQTVGFLAGFFGVPLAPEYDVEIYRIEYETVDAFLGPTIASGAVAIPVGGEAPLPLASYQHATLFENSEAPSQPGATERVAGAAFASLGFVAALPDYLGFGADVASFHPFTHRRSEATAVIDLLRATRQFIREQSSHELDGRVFLVGYSQGGHATLAAQKEIEERHADEFNLVASAAMAGPQDLSNVMAEIILSPEPYASPEFTPYFLLGYQMLYGDRPDLSEVIQEPYASALLPLLDQNHSGAEIAAAMPSNIPREVLSPEFIEAYTSDPNHPLRLGLADNDLLNWAPRTPTHLVHCGGDLTIPFANSQHAYDSFLQAGADPDQIKLIDPDTEGTHSTCIAAALNEAVEWFLSLR